MLTKDKQNMANRASSYWDRRTIQRLIFSERLSLLYIKRIKAMYSRAEKNIQEMIDNVYKNYSKDTGLDIQTLKELLSKSESKKMWNEMKKQGLDQYVKANYKSRITRLERLQMQVYSKAKELYDKERLTSTELYKKILKNNYYRGIYDIQTGVGLDFSFARLDDNTIKALLQDNWSGKNYSERIWGNTDILAESLSEELGGAILSGQGIEKTAGRIRDRFGVAKYYATRLVRTETNHFHAEADFMAYEEMGIDKYVFVATLDNRTSTICQELDGKVFDVKDKAKGVNCPPMHPNCRSTTRAYVDDIAERRMTRWARDPVTGETSVIGNKTYKEWYQDNVAKYGQETVDMSYKMTKNKNSDLKQYKQYKDVLGAKSVGTLENFKKIKYNKEEWKDLKLDFLRKTGITTEKVAKEYINLLDKSVHEGKQGKHILGHNNYISGRSYITIPIHEVQELVNKYAGTGKLLFNKNGWVKKELVEANKTIGIAKTGMKENKTNCFKIHYSKNGVHIVPYYWKREEKK